MTKTKKKVLGKENQNKRCTHIQWKDTEMKNHVCDVGEEDRHTHGKTLSALGQTTHT